MGLTLERVNGGARLSGFIGAGLSSAVSFDGVAVDHPALARSSAELDGLAAALRH